MFDTVLANCRLPLLDSNQSTYHVCLKNGITTNFVPAINAPPKALKQYNIDNMSLMPGFIDAHTHFFDPGYEFRENFFTATLAAASSGITTSIDMPCSSKPTTRSSKDLEIKLNSIKKKTLIDFAIWGGITGEEVRAGETYTRLKGLKDSGVCAIKVYLTSSLKEFSSVSYDELKEVCIEAAKLDLIIGVHAEDFSICTEKTNYFSRHGQTNALNWEQARPKSAEIKAVKKCIEISKQTGTHIHIVHLSSGDAANEIRIAKNQKINITAETCPHYLILNNKEHLPKLGVLAKVAPPIREIEDNEMLWKALSDETLDFVTTDHAPFDKNNEKLDKNLDIFTAFSGISGIETLVPLMLTFGYHKNKMSLKLLSNLLSSNPAKNYRIFPRKGCFQIGSDADFAIIDLDREWIFDQNKMHSKAKYSPFHGYKLKGKTTMTFVRGELVYSEEHGLCVNKGHGKFLCPSKN
jgi:allantoinase